MKGFWGKVLGEQGEKVGKSVGFWVKGIGVKWLDAKEGVEGG